jgi:glycosyltransferase involved in cell wall biosynthesis
LPQQFKNTIGLVSDTVLISVILPFFRPGKLLATAIESILNQTYPNLELLLINNNADVQSAEIANDFSLKDSRIRILYEKEQGIAFALNKGLSKIRGEIIARMDADDVSFPQRLEKQLIYLKNHPETEVEILGHTDSKGEKAYNQKLSEQRATQIYKYMNKLGISKTRMSFNAFGESRPLVPNVDENGNDSPEGRAINRRVEFKLK